MYVITLLIKRYDSFRCSDSYYLFQIELVSLGSSERTVCTLLETVLLKLQQYLVVYIF